MKYEAFRYLYPPRPEHKTLPAELDRYEATGEYIAQPKYNGSACPVATNGTELHVHNRHREPLSSYSKDIDFLGLAKTRNWYVFAGEYLNKGKKGEHGTKEADKYVIWDVLVWDGWYLVGRTLSERLSLLEAIYPCNRGVVTPQGLEIYDHMCCTEYRGIYKAPAYTSKFSQLYHELVKVDLYEGLVLKKINSKLGYGFNEKNNTEWALKCRKANKLYNF